MAKAFEAHGAADPTHSAQLAVYQGGELVLDLTVGPGLEPDSILPVFSSSKGAAAVVVALCVQRGLLDLDERVVTYWPEFAANGKGEVTVRQLLSHQAGLAGVDGGFTIDEVLEHTALAERLAAQRRSGDPAPRSSTTASPSGRSPTSSCGAPTVARSRRSWGRTSPARAGSTSGWGRPRPRTPGGAVRAAAAEDLLAFLGRAAVAGCARRHPDDRAPRRRGGAAARADQRRGLPARRARRRPACWPAPAAWRGCTRALRHDVGGDRLLTDDTVAQVSQLQAQGIELGTELEARFGVIFQVPCPPRWGWGSWRAFGHDGAGGSLAFCDPTYDVAFGYTVQRLPLPGGVDPRAIELTHVLRSCLS